MGGTSYHWYFAYEECYGTTWAISCTSLLLIVVSFGAVFVCSRNMTPCERANPNKFMYQLSSRFKSEYWYWEYVIFVRRIIIACMAVSISAVISKMFFMCIMILFAVLQWQVEPFANHEGNHTEFILLCTLPLVIVTQMPSYTSDSSLETIVIIALSLFILLPIPMAMFYLVRVVHRGYDGWNRRTEMEVNTAMVNGDKREMGHSSSENETEDAENGMATTGADVLDQDTVHTESHQTSAMAELQAVSSVSAGAVSSEGTGDDTGGNLTDVEIEMQIDHNHMDVSAVIDEVNAQDSAQESFY